ncbi:unnamed protein product, partial [Iphiclides podalirius]
MLSSGLRRPRPAWIGRDWCNIAHEPNIAPVTAHPHGTDKGRRLAAPAPRIFQRLVNLVLNSRAASASLPRTVNWRV